MSERDDGGPAFPQMAYKGLGPHYGMTLRDYFAAQALPAAVEILSHNSGWSETLAAIQAYKLADAMLRVRGGS